MRESIFPVIVPSNQNLMESCCREGDIKFILIRGKNAQGNPKNPQNPC